jgi:O-antigen ligase
VEVGQGGAIGRIDWSPWFCWVHVATEQIPEYAPDFDRTVTHYEFDNLIEATAKGEDISTMERVYRWVAGLHMISEKPVFGFGPGNFYNFYHSYTVTSFETYVSDNPEKSGIHSYYLMTVVEQGFPGLLFFLALSFFVFDPCRAALSRGTRCLASAADHAFCAFLYRHSNSLPDQRPGGNRQGG